jgi:hypothetical protein
MRVQVTRFARNVAFCTLLTIDLKGNDVYFREAFRGHDFLLSSRAIAKLPPDEQDDLVNVIRRRLAAMRRQEIVAEVLQAEAELHQSGSAPRSANDVMGGITS